MNHLAYFEIQADDPSALAAFYAAVFGWECQIEPSLPIEYWRIAGGGIAGAILQRPAPVPNEGSGTNAFVCSVEVESFDTCGKLILEHGGRVAMEKFALAGRSWHGYFIDPAGNTFGVIEFDDAAA